MRLMGLRKKKKIKILSPNLNQAVATARMAKALKVIKTKSLWQKMRRKIKV